MISALRLYERELQWLESHKDSSQEVLASHSIIARELHSLTKLTYRCSLCETKKTSEHMHSHNLCNACYPGALDVHLMMTKRSSGVSE